jgi:RND family efflux transporter MFP subunit
MMQPQLDERFASRQLAARAPKRPVRASQPCEAAPRQLATRARAGAAPAGLGGLLVVAALGAVGCTGKQAAAPPPPPPREVESLVLEPTEVRDFSEYLGSLLSRGSVTVLPQVPGYVRAVLVKPGQRVAVGAALLEIDAREEAAALASAQAQSAAAQSSLGLARQVRQRTEALFREGLATAEELDQRRASADAAEAAARAAEAQVTQRRVAVQYNSVRAAVAGVVGDVLVRVGDFVTPSTRATTISQTGALELSIAVPAARAREISVGTPVEVLRDDGSLRLSSPVFFIAPDADPRTQLVEVKAAVPGSEGLRSSELVRARIIYNTRQALTVPARAVLRQSGQAFVFVVLEDAKAGGGKLKVERRPVALGALGEDAFVLERGLAAGDRIATSGIQQLRDGATVKLKPPAAAPAGAAPGEGSTAAPQPAAGASAPTAAASRAAPAGAAPASAPAPSPASAPAPSPASAPAAATPSPASGGAAAPAAAAASAAAAPGGAAGSSGASAEAGR